MIKIHKNEDSSFYNFGSVPGEIAQLSNLFWNNNSFKIHEFKKKKSEIITKEIDSNQYILLKIKQIEKIRDRQIMSNNIPEWYNGDFDDFVRNDGRNAIKNADGTITYLAGPENAEIFALKLSDFYLRGGDENTIINAILFKGDLGSDGQQYNQEINHVFFYFIQKMPLAKRALNKLFSFLSLNKLMLGPNSTGVKVPKGGQ